MNTPSQMILSSLSELKLPESLTTSIHTLLQASKASCLAVYPAFTLKIQTSLLTNSLTKSVQNSIEIIQNELNLRAELISQSKSVKQTLENSLKDLLEKINLIDMYKDYTFANRKPNLESNNDSLDDYIEQKQKQLELIRTLNIDKEEKRKESVSTQRRIHEIEKIIEFDDGEFKELQKLLDRLLSRKAFSDKFQKIRSQKPMKSKTISPALIITDTSNIPQQVTVNNIAIDAKILDSSSQTNIKFHNILSSPSNYISSTDHIISVRTSTEALHLKDLSRSNFERLSIIQARTNYPKSIKSLLMPTYDRLNKIESDKQRGYYSPRSKVNFITEEAYIESTKKSVSPRYA